MRILTLWSAGSSPRMRGAPAREALKPGTLRIIPADAGSTDGIYVLKSIDEDHPRGCGEHLLRVRSPTAAPGIIPADAGSTLNAIRCFTVIWDHPRGCGEHVM